jgi:hypothetical protein
MYPMQLHESFGAVRCWFIGIFFAFSCSGTIETLAQTPPVISCSTNVTVECAGGLTPVSFITTAVDSGGSPLAVTCAPPSDSTFRLGVSNVVCTATDGVGQSSSCNFNVTVVDTTPPEVICNTNRIVQTTDPNGAVVTFLSAAFPDLCSGIAPFSCLPASGSTFPIGVTTVLCRALDGVGNSNGCSFTVTVNRCPVADPLSVNVDQDSQVNFQLPGSDPDNDPLQFIITQPPAHGIVVLQVNTGATSYSPSAGYCGPDSFRYRVTDGLCESPEATVSIAVRCAPTNRCPTASAVSVTVNQDSSLNFQLLASDPDGDALQFTVTQGPAHGTVVVQTQTGAASYTPVRGYCGPDSFRFRVADAICLSAEATVSIDVRCTNNLPPICVAEISCGSTVIALNGSDACVVLDASASSDPEGDPLSFRWILGGPLFNVSLDPGQESGGGGTGSGSGTVTLADNSVQINLSFSGLSTNASAAHIHGPAVRGDDAAVLYPLDSITTLGVTAGTISGTVTLAEGTGGFTIAQQLQQLEQGLWYINIHTATHPAGEIRGQIEGSVLTGPVVTNCLGLGCHSVVLEVSDGQNVSRCETNVCVISACEAVQECLVLVENSTARRNKRPLLASLQAACASFERGNFIPALNVLEAFQRKVAAQVAPGNEAEALTECVQRIIDAIDCSAALGNVPEKQE